jgi:exopolysaccharide production protein ExoQ
MMALALGVGALYSISVHYDALLAMLGRNASLTGRIPMWQAVLGEFVSQRPVLGFGLGAFWNSLSNRVVVQQAVGWGNPVEIGDNGWLDVQLGLGGIGLAFFMLLLMALLTRGADRMRRGHEFVDSLPLVFLLMASLANVAFSLFFEIESGVWLILVAFLFLQASRAESPSVRTLVS